MTLHPNEDITKILLSTPSYLRVNMKKMIFCCRLLSITVSRYDPLGQEYFILAVKTPPLDKSRVAIPDYSGTGDLLSIYLSILYGKRFDNHGLVET